MLESKDKERKQSYAGRKKRDKSAQDTWINQLDAIAVGAELKQDLIDGHSKAVTEKTAFIAHHFGIPDQQIQTWVVNRSISASQRIATMLSLLDKVNQCPVVGSILSIETSYEHPSDLSKRKN